ncbi:DUF4157 domain-containing protein [Poseidonocella pacifica]|uniref:eCIS core domain-containing protein n=1 Tax=Poseidonocella pacifica TaxID=871651 RepID=UPI001587249F|nr:DUF4157 domain-containing protein [Poseidonocella pacifica]
MSQAQARQQASPGHAGDPYEREADSIADRILRMSAPAQAVASRPVDTAASPKRPRATPAGTPAASPPAPAAGVAGLVPGAGRPLDTAARQYMEPRFSHDFSGVRVHTGTRAAARAAGIGAAAFTVGRDIVYGRDTPGPHTQAGRHILAHELTHVIQQRSAPALERTAGAAVVHQYPDRLYAARLDASQCATDCAAEDGTEPGSGSFTLTIYADKEGPFLLLPATHKVGHSWLRLEDDTGKFWTYGFWPQEGYEADDLKADVAGCVHHPDTIHEPTAEKTFDLTAEQFAAAHAKALEICNTTPKYNLFGLQCTEFVKRVLDAAGQGSFGGFGLIWESPNALDSWLQTHSAILGLGVTAATSAGGPAAGLDLSYRYEFYSALGSKLRFYGMARSEISGPVKSLGAGLGVELNPQRVWLPTPFLEGGGLFGDLGALPGQTDVGAGLSASTGLRYNIDEIGVVGIEYNVVKDLVNDDPALNRLMFTAGIRLF